MEPDEQALLVSLSKLCCHNATRLERVEAEAARASRLAVYACCGVAGAVVGGLLSRLSF